MISIRSIVSEDMEALKTVLVSSELFPAELLDDMIAGYLENEVSADIWLTATDQGGEAIALAFCAPETFTEGTCNLYAIAVHKDYQGQGIGRKIMAYLEDLLGQQGQRVLLVETSGLPAYALTRQFYHQCGYHQEATIRDFYQEGEDKVVFWKKLV